MSQLEHPYRPRDPRDICHRCHELAVTKCTACGAPFCAEHGSSCQRCGAAFCAEHLLVGPSPASLWRGVRCTSCDLQITRTCHLGLVKMLALVGLAVLAAFGVAGVIVGVMR